MSSEKFESVEDDLRSIIDEAKTLIETKVPKSSGEERKKWIKAVERQIEASISLLQDLDTEIRHAPLPFRSQMSARVKEYREEVTRVSSSLRQIGTNNYSHSQQELFGAYSSTAAANEVEAGHRARLLQTQEILSRTTQRVDNSQRIANEVEQIGTEVLGELGQQRETLVRTKERLVDTDVNLSKTRKILRSMYRRVMTNKLILVLIICVEIGILIGLVYWKFFKK